MAISLQGVGQRFRGKGTAVDALSGIDLEIADGEFLCVVGPSGCGKTTLLQLLAGFLRPTEGTVSIDGVEVDRPRPGPRRRVPAAEPVPVDDRGRERGVRAPPAGGAPRPSGRPIAERQLELVGLGDFGAAAPYELSGGMQQRCQIARVLANDPTVMLLDEPFGALDALTRDRLQDELHRVWLGSGKTAFFITHSVEEAAYLGTRVIVLSPRPGRIVFDEPVPFAAGVAGPGAARRPGLRAVPRARRRRDPRVGGDRSDRLRLPVPDLTATPRWPSSAAGPAGLSVAACLRSGAGSAPWCSSGPSSSDRRGATPTTASS